MNPTAFLFWAVCAGFGYLWDDWHGAFIGGLSAMATSLAVELTFDIFRKR